MSDDLSIRLKAELDKKASEKNIEAQLQQIEKNIGVITVKTEVDKKGTDDALKMQAALGKMEQNRWKENEKIAKAQADAQNKYYEQSRIQKEKTLQEETKIRLAIKKWQEDEIKRQEALRQKAIEYNQTLKSQTDKLSVKYDLGDLSGLKSFQEKMKSGLSFKNIDDIPQQIKKTEKELIEITDKLKLSHEKNNQELKEELKLEEQIQKALIEEAQIRRKLEEIKEKETNDIKKKREEEEKTLQIYKQMASIKFQNLQSKYGDLSGNAQFQSIKNKVNSSDFGAGDIKQSNVDIKSLESNLRSASSAGKTFGDVMKHNITKFGEFLVAGSLIMQTVNAFKYMIQYTIEMDTAITDLSKVVEFNAEQLDYMKNKAIDLGKELGKSSVDIAKAMAEFGRIYKTTQEITELTKVSIMASNVTSMTAEESAKALSTTMIAFKKDASEAMGILDQFNELQNNFRISAEDLSASIGKVGNSAVQAGVSIEKLEGYTTAMVAATGITGAEAGTALKSSISRMFRIGLEGEEDAGRAEEALAKVGIAVREVSGNFRSFDVILDEVAKNWGNWSNVTQMNIAQQIAGTQHYSKLIGLLENYKIANDATSKALNSQNSALIENQKYLDSAEGKINILSTTIQEKFNQSLDSGLVKNFLDVITNVINVFGTIPRIIGLAVVGLIAWQVATVLTTTNTFALTGAIGVLQASISGLWTALGPAGWVVLGLTAIIGIIGGVVTAVKNAEKAQVEYIKNTQMHIQSLQDQKKGLQDLSQEYDKLKEKQKTGNIDTTEKQKLLEIQKQLVEQYGVSATAIDSEGKAYSDSANLIKLRNQELEREIKLEQQKLNTAVKIQDKDNTSDIKKAIEKRNEIIKSQADITDLINEAQRIQDDARDKSFATQASASAEIYSMLGDRTLEQAKSKQLELTKGLQDINDVIDEKSADRIKLLQYYGEESAKEMETQGNKLSDSGKLVINKTAEVLGKQGVSIEKQVNVIKQITQKLGSSDFNNLIQEYNKFKTDENIAGVDKTSKAINKLISDILGSKPEFKTLKDQIESIFGDSSTINQKPKKIEIIDVEKAEKDLKNITDNLEGLRQVLNEVSSGDFKPTEKSLEFLNKNFPELVGYLNDIPTLQQKINEKFKEQEQAANEAYRNMMMDNKEFADTVMANNSQVINDLAAKYNIDRQNWTTLNEFKKQVNSQLIKEIAGDWANYYDAQGDLLETQFRQSAEFQAELNKFSNVQGPGQTAATYAQELQQIESEKLIHNALNKSMAIKVEMKKASEKLKSSLPDFSTSFATTSSGSSKKPSETSKAAEVEANEKLILRDRYMALNQALQQTNSLLETNKAIQENTPEKERISLLNQEIELLKQKQTNIHNIAEEQRKELEETRNKLSSQGIKFDGSGNIANLESIQSSKLGSVNAHRTDKNKNTYKDLKDSYDDFEATLKRFQDLQKSIPDQGVDWQKIQAEIGKVEQEKVKIRLSIQEDAFKELDIQIKQKEDEISAIDVQLDLAGEKEFDKKITFIKQKTNLAENQINDFSSQIQNLNRELETETEPELINNIKERVLDLNDKTNTVRSSLKSLASEFANVYIAEGEAARQSLLDKKQGSQNKLDMMGEFNFTGRSEEFTNQINLNKEDISGLQEKIIDWKIAIKQATDPDVIELFNNKIKETQQTIIDLNKENSNLTKSLDEDKLKKVQKEFENIQKSTKPVNDKLALLKHQLSLLSEGDKPKQLELTQQLSSGLISKIDILKDKIQILQNRMSKTDDTNVFNQYKQDIETLTSEIMSSESELFSYQNSLIDKTKEATFTWLDEEMEKLDESSNAAKEASEAKIDAIQKQIDILEKENDQYEEQEERLKRIKDITEQQAKVDELKQEKNVKVYKKGEGFVWSVDAKKLKEETDQLQDMQKDFSDWENDLAYKKKIDNLKAQQDSEKATYDAIEKGNQSKQKQLKKFQDEYNKAIEKDGVAKVTALQTLVDNMKKVEGANYADRITKLQAFIDDYNARMARMNSAASMTSNVPAIQSNTPSAAGTGVSGIAQKTAVGTTSNVSAASVAKSLSASGMNITSNKSSVPQQTVAKKYAEGGLNTSPGFHWLDGTTSKPERILNPEQTNLFDKFMDWLPKFNNFNVPVMAGNTNTSSSKIEQYTINIDRIETNDATSLMNQLKRISRSKK